MSTTKGFKYYVGIVIVVVIDLHIAPIQIFSKRSTKVKELTRKFLEILKKKVLTD